MVPLKLLDKLMEQLLPPGYGVKINILVKNWISTKTLVVSPQNRYRRIGLCQIYVRAGLGKFGPTQPLTTNLCPDLLSFFNFLLSLKLLAHWFFWFKPVKTGKIRKVKDWASAETTITKSYLTKSWIIGQTSLMSDMAKNSEIIKTSDKNSSVRSSFLFPNISKTGKITNIFVKLLRRHRCDADQNSLNGWWRKLQKFSYLVKDFWLADLSLWR